MYKKQKRKRQISNRKRERERMEVITKIFTCALVKIHTDLRWGGAVCSLIDQNRRHGHSAMSAAGGQLGEKTCIDKDTQSPMKRNHCCYKYYEITTQNTR